MTPRKLRRVCVYCGSSDDIADHFKTAARDLAMLLVSEGIGVVTGGGSVGLMGVVADEVLARGGEIIGVIPEKLERLELGHRGLRELHVVPDMHSRKRRMADLSCAFVALPGGYGTLEELAEVTTWTQLNDHLKPVGLLNVQGYYDPLLAWVQGAADAGFVRPQHRDLIQAATTPAELLHRLRTSRIPRLHEWLTTR